MSATDPLSDARIEFSLQCDRYLRHWKEVQKAKETIRATEEEMAEITRRLAPFVGWIEERFVSAGPSYGPHVLKFARDTAGTVRIKVYPAPPAYAADLPASLIAALLPQPEPEPELAPEPHQLPHATPPPADLTDAEIDEAALDNAAEDVADEIVSDVLTALAVPADSEDWGPDDRVALGPSHHVPAYTFDEAE